MFGSSRSGSVARRSSQNFEEAYEDSKLFDNHEDDARMSEGNKNQQMSNDSFGNSTSAAR